MAAESNAVNANNTTTQIPSWNLPNQQSRAFERTTERSRSSSDREEWWDLPPEVDPERMMVPGRPPILPGSNSDSRLNQNRKILERDPYPPLRHRETTVDDHGSFRRPFSRGSYSSRSSSSGPSQPRRAASPFPPPRKEEPEFKARSESRSGFRKFEERKREYESVFLRTPTNIDVVYNSAEAKNVTVNVELDLFNDLGEELEIFNRLTRTGNFSLAKKFFDSHLEAHVDDPAVFVQYAEMLLEQGDFRSLLLLDGRHVFRKYGHEELKDSESPIHRLELNWKLIRAVALCHSQHSLSSVWEGIDRSSRVIPDGMDTNSTELKIFSLANRLHHLTRTRTIFDSLNGRRDWRQWTDWQALYRRLLAKDRIWDFRDLFFALIESCDTEDVLAELVGSTFPQAPDQMLADWETSSPDESTSLALLDMLSFIALNAKTPSGILPLGEESMRSAERIGNSILDNFSHAVHTRPFIQWIIAKALVESGTVHFDYLLDYPGQAFFHSRAKMPYYIPVRKENPGWLSPNLAAIGRESIEIALSSTRMMQDYQSEAQCLKELALKTKAPGALLDDLAHLQKSKQLDEAGYLSTCLSRYLTCRDESSKASLLRDLESFGWWHNPSNLIDPNTAAAKDVLQRALSQENVDKTSKSMESALRYYEHVDGRSAETIDRNITTQSRSGFQAQPPSLLHDDSGRQRRRGGNELDDRRTNGQASKDFGSGTEHGNDGTTRNDQPHDYYPPSPRRDTGQSEEAHQAHYSSDDGKYDEVPAELQTNDGNDRVENAFYDSQNAERLHINQRDPQRRNHIERQVTSTGPHPGDETAEVWDEDKWEYRYESSNVRRHQHHDTDGYTSARSSGSSRGGRHSRGKTVQNDERRGRRSRSRSLGHRRNSAPGKIRQDVHDADNSRKTRERSDQDQQHAQAGDASRRTPPPQSVRTPFRWGEPVVEEFGSEDEAASESRNDADDEFDVSEVMEEVGARDEVSKEDSADSKAGYSDAASHFDEKP